MTVVGPHFLIRNLIAPHPERDGLVRLRRFTLAPLCHKHRAVQGVAVGELEVQLPALLRIARGDAEFFLHLADDRLQRRFARFEAAARTVDFSRSQTALLVDKEHFVTAGDKAKVGPLARLPGGPVGRHVEVGIIWLGPAGEQPARGNPCV